MFGNLIISALLTASIGAKTLPVTTPVHDVFHHDVVSIDYASSPQVVSGVYNFRDIVDFDGVDDYFIQNSTSPFSETIQIDRFVGENGGMPYERHNCPISLNNITYWLESISIGWDTYQVFVDFDYYYPMNYHNTYEISFDDEFYSLDNFDIAVQEFIFNIRDGLVLSSNASKCFDAMFTHYDNAYTTTYNGYIHFLNNVQFTYPFTCFGTEIIDTSMYYDLLVPMNPSGDFVDDTLIVQKCNYYTYSYTFYEDVSYRLPLAAYNRDWLCGNFKMSLTSERNLGYIAYYGYVRDTSYDNVTFKDFFFSLVDTPVYFASSLLSFELFGVNLFVALTGLLTLCCILLLIKKFW